MKKQTLFGAFAISNVALLGPLLGISVGAAAGTAVGDKVANADPVPWTGPVPKANCGPRDRTESGLQGQTTPEERSSGDSTLGYNCNLELVGKYQGEGAFSQDGPAYADDCAYYATDNITPQQKHHGVVVVDASDPRHPQPTAYLDDTPAILAPHETLKHNDRRHLLAVAEFNGPGFAVYDTSADCRYPARKARRFTSTRRTGVNCSFGSQVMATVFRSYVLRTHSKRSTGTFPRTRATWSMIPLG